MATREQKKNKLKLAKQKQKENRYNNQSVKDKFNKFHKIIVDKDSYDNHSKYPVGIRESTLSLLRDITKNLKNGINDDEDIEYVAKTLSHLAINPIPFYLEVISAVSSSTNDKKKIKSLNDSLKKAKCGLNNTERALLSSQMQSIIAEYFMVNEVYDAHDYGAIKVAFEVAYQAIYNGLQEHPINSLILNVQYGDNLESIEIEYEDSTKKYNLNDNIIIFPIWKSLDNLYHYYSIYRKDYKNFSQESINSLATAKNMYDEYKEREQGEEIISYKGIAMNYLGVLEEELKNLISKSFELDMKSITFNDAINYLNKKYFENLYDFEMIEVLHEMRKLRNKSAHPGETITSEDIENIERKLIGGQILKFIDWNLTSLLLNIKI